ncbi:MAG: hypothetical protein ACD_73C00332G0001 [uncultured bacterium]|nr:MAG: hypothetical protein ACD_73C00332G0001 [uncultured bacterium]
MDLEGRDPFELIDEIEKVLNLPCFTMTWPIGQGARFKGVYDLSLKRIRLFTPGLKTLKFEQEFINDLNDAALPEKIDEGLIQILKDDLELLMGAGHDFNSERFLSGHLSPVFFGSAVKNFGIQELLDAFLKFAPAPTGRPAEERNVEACEADLTGVVFKIQANMDPKHRDRTAFVRICSGVFNEGMSVYHVREDREFKINNAIQFLSHERKNIDQAYAGDIIGIRDRNNLMIGDTITQGESLKFTGIPQFSPDLFCRVDLRNPIKSKQLHKGLEQLAEEGTSQIFRRKNNTESILGVVGQLQFEVVKFRLLNEYGADALFEPLNYGVSRWFYAKDKKDLTAFHDYYESHIVYDVRGYPLILFRNEWERDYVANNNPKMLFYASLFAYEQALKE